MKIYRLSTEQQLPVTLKEAWKFFTDARNLERITPPDMSFKVLSDVGDGRVYPGMIINYIVKPMLNIPIRWTTEISYVEEEKYFVDEQRFGPYAFWHHKHFFEENENGVLMKDIVDYALPLGFLGRMMQPIMVEPRLQQIFDYRFEKMKEIFPEPVLRKEKVPA